MNIPIPPTVPVVSDPMSRPFFVTGGTLPRDAPCYIRRTADDDLFAALQQSEFCHVLTARQMGKSSLMVRTATRLRQTGVTVALLDLTAIGQNLTTVQWYRGMLGRLGRQLQIEDELEDRWETGAELGGMQRWTETLSDVLLASFTGPVVVFIDEIDAVRSLPFSTDEFFAALRECYNRRSYNPEFKRLTFCLMGVATPSELVQDTRHTPFNIGRRIELNDFSRDEVMTLAPGFTNQGNSPATTQRLLERVHYWTEGHPYLTQRLCQSALEASITEAKQVDALCAELFFGRAFPKRDDNILFVQDRLLRGSYDVAATLDLYRKVLSGKRCVAGEDGESDANLRLAGIVRTDALGVMKSRNRIYRHIFNRAWIQAHFPDAELRRQRNAFRQGQFRALTISGVVFLVVSYFGYRMFQSERRTLLAESNLRQQLFVSDMNLTRQSLAENHIARAVQLLADHQSDPKERNRFEWRYLWSQCHPQQKWFQEPAGGAIALRFAADGTVYSVSEADLSVRAWEPDGDRPRVKFPGLPANLKGRGGVPKVAFAPDGTRLARLRGNSCEFVTLAKGEVRNLPTATAARFLALPAFSHDGTLLVTGDYAGMVRLWDVDTGNMRKMYPLPNLKVAAVALSPDNRTLAITGVDGQVVLWDVDAPRPKRSFQGHLGMTHAIGFSPDGKVLVTGGRDGMVRIWDAGTGHLVSTLPGHTANVGVLAFTNGGNLLATGSDDQTVRLWHTASWKTAGVIRGHRDALTTLAFSPDGKHLATASDDGVTATWDIDAVLGEFRFAQSRDDYQVVTAMPSRDGIAVYVDTKQNLRVKNATSGQEVFTRLPTERSIAVLSVSHKGRRFVVVDEEGSAVLGALSWPGTVTATLRQIQGHGKLVTVAAFSPDDRYFAVGSATGTVWVRNAETGELIHQFTIPAEVGVSSLAFSPDGTQLAVGGFKQGVVHLLHVPSGRTHAVLPGPSGAIGEMAFSPDGRFLATGGFDATIRIFPLTAANPTAESRTLEGHAGKVYTLTFSPDGQTLASGGKDGITRFWDVNTAHETMRIPSPDISDSIASLRFDQAGDVLTTVYKNGLLIRRMAYPKIQEAKQIPVNFAGFSK
ncbi:MAG: AAA-like domain-containing protein [Armatimonas sp.]